jgi:hypothetical protein
MMTEKVILKSQANEIYQAIRDAGLDPMDFKWGKRKSKNVSNLLVSELIHRPTGYFFVFDFTIAQLSFCMIRFPGLEAKWDEKFIDSWVSLLGGFNEWLTCIEREIKASDLWAAISQKTQLTEVASSSDITNEPFTPEEQEKIAVSIHEIKKYIITTHDPKGERAENVSNQLEYLVDASKRLGCKDWITIAIGVFFNIAVGLVLNSEAARGLFRFAATILHWVWDGAVLSLPR